MTSPPPLISIIVPTFREALNIPHLSQAIAEAMVAASYDYEIIFADDDSRDGTEAACAELSTRYPVRLLTRRADPGLSQSVIDGIFAATGKYVVVMDADLSHPPEKIQPMIRLLEAGNADFIWGSRYAGGGSLDESWSFYRKLNSKIATLPALLLVRVKDPMSGFFAMKRADMPPRENLAPLGYKIGLEICVKRGFPPARVAEVPIHFQDRQYGESKLSLQQQLLYLRHIARLYRHKWPQFVAFSLFCSVGLVGMIVDLAFYMLLLSFGIDHVVARGASFWPAATTTWFLNRNITFRKRDKVPILGQWVKFLSSCGIGFLVNWGSYTLLTAHTEFFGERHLLAFFCRYSARRGE